MTVSSKFSALVFLILTSAAIGYGQCADAAEVTTNDHCVTLAYSAGTWPGCASLPSTIEVMQDGGTTLTGTLESCNETDMEVVYKTGGGGGACNATKQLFSGTIDIGGDVCSYQNGVLPVEFVSFDVRAMDENDPHSI